jgi:hypothetical protein
MRVLVVVAAATGLFALGLFGFGHLLGAWDSPAEAGGGKNGNPTATDRGTVASPADQDKDRKATHKRRSTGEQVPPSVARRVDRLCLSAREDALSLMNMAPPTNAQQLKALFARLRQLNRDYNDAILRVLRWHGADARFHTLRRLFQRDEKLFDQLVWAIGEIDSSAGRAVFESRLDSLRGLAARQTVILEELGTRACDNTLAPTS